MTNIYLVRHAEAEGNIYRRAQGWYDSKISPKGEKQIDALAERFRDIHIDAVYSSDLYRTRRTAEALCKPKGLPLRLEPRFREVHVGTWEDRTFGELERTQPEALPCRFSKMVFVHLFKNSMLTRSVLTFRSSP